MDYIVALIFFTHAKSTLVQNTWSFRKTDTIELIEFSTSLLALYLKVS